VVDTDVASFVFKWHPVFAPQYVNIVRGFELVVCFMTVAEMRQGALGANWGERKCALLGAYLEVRNESMRKGRQMGTADAWIAAAALVLSAPLVTNNPSDYRHLNGLQLISASA
jgi:predicted nucleic acid-binding protein